MIDGETILAVIPARGQSKGLPRKNILPIGGKPLIVWTIEAAAGSKLIDQSIVSTDDAEIAEIARNHGVEVPFMRSSDLATDDATSIDVVLDACSRLPGFDWVVLLQPTSPLRSYDDIDRAINQCTAMQAPACVSVSETHQHPYWTFFVQPDGTLRSVIAAEVPHRRQDLPKTYALNGAIYIARIPWLEASRNFISPETVAFEMDAKRSIDIDTASDFAIAAMLIQQQHA